MSVSAAKVNGLHPDRFHALDEKHRREFAAINLVRDIPSGFPHSD
jgi:hypothetical protein